MKTVSKLCWKCLFSGHDWVVWLGSQPQLFRCNRCGTTKLDALAYAKVENAPIYCSGADNPDERCPRRPSDCLCWDLPLDVRGKIFSGQTQKVRAAARVTGNAQEARSAERATGNAK